MQPSKWVIGLLLVLSFVGFLDAAYLTTQHYLGVPPPCSLLEGCEEVTTSRYATVFGIPIALGGALYYLAIFVLLISYIDRKNDFFLKIALLLTPLGFLTSVVLVYLQLFVIDAICLYCMGSALTSTLLFGFSIYIHTSFSKREL